MMAFILTSEFGFCAEYGKSYNRKDFGLNGPIAKVTIKDCQFKKEFGEIIRVGSKDEKQIYFFGNGNVYKVISSLTSYNKYNYDDHGNMTFEMKVTKEGGECCKIDDYTFCDDDTTDVKEYRHIYSSNGKLSETKVFSINDGSSTQIERIIYSYSVGGEKIVIYDKNSIIGEIVSKGLDREIRTKSNDLSWAISKDKLDNKGRLIQRIITAEHEFMNIKKVQKVSSETHIYDNHGNEIKKSLILYLNEQNPIKENLTSKYTYDNHGNWVSMLTYNGNELVSWKEREIIYAENESEFDGLIQSDMDFEKARKQRINEYKIKIAPKKAALEEEKAKEIAKGPICNLPDNFAHFPGDMPATIYSPGARQDHLYAWINANKQDVPFSSKVKVEFVVECDGSISNVKIIRGYDEDANKEAIRLVKTMPKWVPAEKDGVIVRSIFVLDITF